MRKARWLLFIATALGCVLWLLFGGGSRRELERYKAELRAKGEKLTFAELGFPRPPANGEGLRRLTNAVNRMPARGFSPGEVSNYQFANGRVRVAWRGDTVGASYGRGQSNETSWSVLQTAVEAATNELAEIRAATELAPPWLQFDPVSSFPGIGSAYSFVQMRNAAQWLNADALMALHLNDRARAAADLHALTRLTDFNREDPTLVAAMIRVAIAGLGVELTWQELQRTDWTEAELAAMQQDWERVELLPSLERAFLGERAVGELVFDLAHVQGAGTTLTRLSGPRGGTQPIGRRLGEMFTGMMWKLNSEQDELLLLRHYQTVLDSLRRLRHGEAYPPVSLVQSNAIVKFEATIAKAGGFGRFRYMICAMTIPNHIKATQTAVRNEAMRRLAITVIALKRFELAEHRLPESLEELVPRFLASVPIDPMSNQPMRYRRKAEGGFLLYSVGEDGKDDGGAAIGQSDWLSTRDIVWPEPEE